MAFGLSAEQRELREAVARLCARFGDEYWLKKDDEGGFPHEFHQAMAEAGWLGIAMPEAYGGSGLGITEAAILMQAVAESGAGFSGASAIHMNIFGLHPVVVFGTDQQKQRRHRDEHEVEVFGVPVVGPVLAGDQRVEPAAPDGDRLEVQQEHMDVPFGERLCGEHDARCQQVPPRPARHDNAAGDGGDQDGRDQLRGALPKEGVRRTAQGHRRGLAGRRHRSIVPESRRQRALRARF